MNGKWLTLVLCLLLTGTAHPNPEPEPVRTLVLMIGDGMGLAQVSMLQIGNDYAPTAFDRAQQVALLVTRSANNRVTDSAAGGDGWRSLATTAGRGSMPLSGGVTL